MIPAEHLGFSSPAHSTKGWWEEEILSPLHSPLHPIPMESRVCGGSSFMRKWAAGPNALPAFLHSPPPLIAMGLDVAEMVAAAWSRGRLGLTLAGPNPATSFCTLPWVFDPYGVGACGDDSSHVWKGIAGPNQATQLPALPTTSNPNGIRVCRDGDRHRRGGGGPHTPCCLQAACYTRRGGRLAF